MELRTQVSTVSDHFAVDLRHDADGFLYGSDVGLQVRFDLQLGLSIAEWNSIKRTLVWLGERTQSEFPVQNSTHHCLRLCFLPGYVPLPSIYSSLNDIYPKKCRSVIIRWLQFSFRCHSFIDNITFGKSIL